MSFYTDSNGVSALSSTHKREIASVFGAELGAHTENANRICEYLPDIRKRRKNIKYLTSEESEAIREYLYDTNNSLSARSRALGMLLYFTGLRASDAANLRFDDIDWKKDEIHLFQHKTGAPAIIPLSASVDNAVLDYIQNESPDSNNSQIFLCGYPPYDPISGDTMWMITSNIYRAAGIRQMKNVQHGAHPFRYHLAAHLAEQEIPQPIISEIWGHEVPKSLDYYLAADMEHLKECALSIEEFPVSEEVFSL